MPRVRHLLASVALFGALTLAPSPAPAVSRAHHSFLDQKLPEIKFDNIAFKDGVEFLRDVTGANIHVNWRAIETAGISQDTNVNMQLRNVTVRKALSLLLSEAGEGTTLTYFVDQGVIEITTKELADKDVFTRVYPVEDLVVEIPDFTDAPDLSLLATSTSSQGGGSGGLSGGAGGGGLFGGQNTNNSEKQKTRTERANDLVALIRETVYPDIWRENGGPASIRYYNGQLVVTAPRSVHEALGGYYD